MMGTSNSIWEIGLAVMCLLASFGCAAHSVLFLVILSSSNLRRTPSNSFIISLSLTGLLAASVVFPSAISVYFEYRSGSTKCCSNCSTSTTNDISWGMCSIFQGLHNFTIYNSAWLVSAIAIERHVSITRPFYAASTFNYVLLNAALTLGSTLLALIPILLSPDPVCYSLYAHYFPDLILSSTVFVLVYVLPCAIIVLMYAKVYRVARDAHDTTLPAPSPYPTETDAIASNLRIWTVNSLVTVSQTESTETLNTKRNKAIKILVLIIGTYFTLWSPYWILNFVSNLDNFEESTCGKAIPLYVTDNGSTVVTWLMYTSISINPLLYGLLNRAVRSEFRRKMQIVGRLWSRCYKRTETTSQERDGYGQENFWEFLERTNSPSIGQLNV